MRTWELKAHHIKLLQRAIIRWGDGDVGAPAIDPRRPYGHYDVARSICFAMDWTEEELDHDGQPLWSSAQLCAALAIHLETEVALQIILASQTFEPGMYEQFDPYEPTAWRPA